MYTQPYGHPPPPLPVKERPFAAGRRVDVMEAGGGEVESVFIGKEWLHVSIFLL